MRRFTARPYGASIRPLRLITLLAAMGVLFVLYQRFRDPATWQSLLDIPADTKTDLSIIQPDPASGSPATMETVVAGPNELDKDEKTEFEEMTDLVSDRVALKPREMHAYWRLMTWSRTEPFTTLRQRAMKGVPFTQLWEQPDKYRGRLISLRLHVRRVLKYEAPDNPQQLIDLYEAWGWTDESRSFPYVVVFPECPAELPIGTDVRAEVEFAGYFLKIMSYSAYETTRGAPLLVGRIRVVPPRGSSRRPALTTNEFAVVMILGGLTAVVSLWFQFQRRPPVRTLARPSEDFLFDLTSSDDLAELDLSPVSAALLEPSTEREGSHAAACDSVR